jgi:hypothetical protein
VLLHAPALSDIFDRSSNGARPLRDELQLDGISCRPLSGLGAIATGLATHDMASNGQAAVEANVVPLVNPSSGENLPYLLLLDAAALQNGQAPNVESVLRRLSATDVPHTCILIGDDLAGDNGSVTRDILAGEEIFAVLSQPRPENLRQMARRALDHCVLQARLQGMERELELYTQHLKELNSIGVALSSERDLDTLLELILTKSRDITDADASSLYLVELDPTDEANPKPRLRFKLSQNDSLTFNVNQPMPISRESLAGYVALTGESLRFADVYDIASDVPYRWRTD